jgi:hypothetical protein
MSVTGCPVISLKLRHTKGNKRLTVPLCPAVARLRGSSLLKGTENKGIAEGLIGNVKTVNNRPGC